MMNKSKLKEKVYFQSTGIYLYLDFCHFLQTPHFENLHHQLSLLQVQRRLRDIAPVVKGMDTEVNTDLLS